MSSFHLTIARVGESLFEGEASTLTIPTAVGEITILAHHEPYVVPTKKGTARVKDAEGKEHAVKLLEDGVLEVSRNHATVVL